MPDIGVHVAPEIGDPVGVEDQERVGAPLAGALAELPQGGDRGGTLALQRAFLLRNQDRGDMRDLGGQHDLAHGASPLHYLDCYDRIDYDHNDL